MESNLSTTTLPALDDPEAFARWWDAMEDSGVTPDALAERLEATLTPLGAARAALILGHSAEVRDRVRKLAGQAFGGDDSVKLFGLAIIGILDCKEAYQFVRGELRTTIDTVRLLNTLLDTVKQSTNRPPLLSEVEARLHRAIGECATINGEYDLARRHLVLAIAFGQGLIMHSFVYFTRLFLANVAVNAGAMGEARAHYSQLIADVQTPADIVLEAQVHTAMTLFWSGEDTHALQFIKEILAQYPRHPYVTSYCDALKILTGVKVAPENLNECQQQLPNGLYTLVEVFQALWHSEGKRKRDQDRKVHLTQARKALEALRASGNLLNALGEFLKGLIALRSQEMSVAVKAAQAALKIETVPSVRILVLGLALEIAIDWNGFELIRTDDLTANIAAELGKLSSSARRDMANRFALLLPRAGALFAVSPEAEGEFISVLTNSILDVSVRPIKVFESHGLRPAHAVQITLEAFGFPVIEADGGGQLAGEEQVLFRRVGECDHWFTPVPPASLIFCLLRTHEHIVGVNQTHRFTTWLHAAGQVARRFGVLPKYTRGPYTLEATKISEELGNLLVGKFSVSDFRRVVENRALLDSKRSV
jgi:hypothetical protein